LKKFWPAEWEGFDVIKLFGNGGKFKQVRSEAIQQLFGEKDDE
jgi:hypothetical protein